MARHKGNSTSLPAIREDCPSGLIGKQPSLLWATDGHLRVTSLFGAGLAPFSPGADFHRGATLGRVFGSEDPSFPPVEAARNALGGEASSFVFEWQGCSFEAHTEPLRNHRLQVVGCTGFALDISERRKTAHALSLQEAYFQQLFESSPQAIVMVDLEDRLLKANHGFEELFGYSEEELLGCPLDRAILPELYREEGAALAEAVREGDTIQAETVRRHRDGHELLAAILAFPIRHGDEIIGIFVVYEDITERKRSEERLRHEALHDDLTGLPNRSLFSERLTYCLNRAQREPETDWAVLFLDLDRFKLVNDSLGHAAGDRLLVAIADRLMTSVRPVDTVARLGGDEFVVLLEKVSGVGDVIRVAHRIQHELEAPFDVEGTEIFVTTSIGITLSSPDYRYPGEMIRDADTAMYRAKAHGGACHAVFDSRMHDVALERLQLEMDLRRGLERGEFCLHYQPIVNLGSGRIEGFESLIRWCHPERGLLLPGDFLEVAEETGLTVELSSFVLNESCSQVQEWLEIQGDLAISVNLSAKQFRQPHLPAQIDNYVRTFHLPPESLGLEITEGVILHSTEAEVEAFDALRANAVRLYLDDFGTGYSSLGYLESFPVDCLKIDRSFVSGAADRTVKREITEAIVHLAHSLDLEVVAEGIEDSEQLSWIRSLGCEYGQGYLFSPPVQGREATELLKRGPQW